MGVFFIVFSLDKEKYGFVFFRREVPQRKRFTVCSGSCLSGCEKFLPFGVPLMELHGLGQ